jgi:hypothetical protein
MEKEITKQLKKMQSIAPSPEFKLESLRLIVTSPQEKRHMFKINFREMATLGAALALASLMLVMLLGGFSNSSQQLAGREAPSFDIKIGQAQYFENEVAQRDVALRLQRIEDSVRQLDYSGQNGLLNDIYELRKTLIP